MTPSDLDTLLTAAAILFMALSHIHARLDPLSRWARIDAYLGVG